MNKENLCYHQNKNKRESILNWKNKSHENFRHKKKGTKFYKKYGNNYWGYQGINFKNNKQQNPTTIKEREVPTVYNKTIAQREPLKCWECGEPHYFKDCPIIKKGLKFLITYIQIKKLLQWKI